jgi:hypothetical protein
MAKKYHRSNREVTSFTDHTGKVWDDRFPPESDSIASMIESSLAGQRSNKTTTVPQSISKQNPQPQQELPQVVNPSPTKNKFTKPRKPQMRPGLKPDGSPATQEYIISVKQYEAKWLRDRADIRSMALSRMMLGIGLGLWALPNTTPEIKAEPKGWTTISVTICDDDWDMLIQNATNAAWPENCPAPAKPDPVTFCVLATLGFVKLQLPEYVPVLATVEEHIVLADMHRAHSIAKLWNPWLSPRPDVATLGQLINQVQKTFAQAGIRKENAATELHNVVEQLEAGHTACIDCSNLWRRFETIAATIDIGCSNYRERK